MKSSKSSLRHTLIACAMSLSLAAPVLAQQEVSPDRFEFASQSTHQVDAHKAANSSTHKGVNKQTARIQHIRQAGKQTAALKQTSNYQQTARN